MDSIIAMEYVLNAMKNVRLVMEVDPLNVCLVDN